MPTPPPALTRRRALHLATLAALGGLVAACSGATTQPAATGVPTATTTAPMPSAGGSAPAAPASNTIPTPPPTTTASATAAQEPTRSAATATPIGTPAAAGATPTAAAPSLATSMVAAATRFLDALLPATRGKATYPFADPERVRWHWTTPGGFPRNGVPLNELDESQRALALALLRASVSAAGYRKALDIMSLQRDLGSDPLQYYVTVFGTPQGREPWGWRFEGHHLSRQFTVVGERVAMTPFFLGAWPTTTDAKLRAMPREEDAARELVRAVGDRAVFRRESLTDHVTQNQPTVAPLDPVGVAYGELDTAARGLVMEIIGTYLGVLHPSIGDPLLASIRAAGLDTVRFGWAGSTEPGRPHYYRLQGPTFLLEFDNSRNGGTHIHSVWRDFAGDFGRALG